MRKQDRRAFLCAVPAAAAGGFAVSALLAQLASAQSTAPLSEGNYQVISAESLAEDLKELEANPGTKHLFRGKNFIFDLTVERAASGMEFEWHEGRDHIFHILDGSTVYEIGGTPQGTHGNGPGEWLAPTSEGATKVPLKAGDALIIRRGTPHKRTTTESVTLGLISTITPASS